MTAKTSSAHGPASTATRIGSDGHPHDEVQYREHKVILAPARLASAKSFTDFAKLVRHAAKELDVALFHGDLPHSFRVREVLFYDTPGADLYEHSFILRRRTFYREGWPEGDPELTFKFRHVDLERAAEVDVRPHGLPTYRVKFKDEILPLRDRLGGLRSLFSHNVVATAPAAMPRTMGELAALFPAVGVLALAARTPLQLVSNLAVEEVSADVGQVNFGHGLEAKATLAMWRDRGSHAPLSGEFSYQCKFQRYDDLHAKSRKRSEEFFVALQQVARDWVQVGVTKTGVVYRWGGGKTGNHE